MQTIKVRTTQNVYIHYPLASIGDRIIAYLIDRLAVITYCIAVAVALVSMDVEIWWLYLIFIGVPFLFYNLLCEILMNGQTLGKRALKIRVIRIDGTEASVGDFILRWLFGFIDYYIFSGAIALLVIAIGGKGQRLGDLVAGTTVIKIVATREISAAEIFITPADTYQPVFPDVTALSPNEIDIIHQALRVGMTGNTKPAEVVTEKIKAMLRIQSDLSPLSFLETIIKDYNHLNARL
jgi:uncharacterized RDD family membrane protein YckC